MHRSVVVLASFATLLLPASLLSAEESGTETAPAADAKPQPAPEKFGDWALVCPDPEEMKEGEGKLACRLVQSAILNVEAKEGEEPRTQRVMLTAIGYVAEEEDPVLTVIVPLGILLPSGVVLEAEGYDQLRMPVQRCDANGCLAFVPMKAQLVAAFKEGKEAHVTFYNIQRKPSRVRISLSGYSKGMTALDQKRK